VSLLQAMTLYIIINPQHAMTETISDALSKLYDKLTGWVERFILLLPNLLIAVVVFGILYTIGKLLRRTLNRPLHRMVHSRALVDLILSIISIATIAFGVFIALSIIGLDKAVTSLLAGVGIVGLALGLLFRILLPILYLVCSWL
jgi:small-conductance mechanosensitive channel